MSASKVETGDGYPILLNAVKVAAAGAFMLLQLPLVYAMKSGWLGGPDGGGNGLALLQAVGVLGGIAGYLVSFYLLRQSAVCEQSSVALRLLRVYYVIAAVVLGGVALKLFGGL